MTKRNLPTRRFIKPTFEFLIEKKRDGGEFTQEEIRYIIDSTLDGEILPAYANRARWVEMMLASIATAEEGFGSDRMVRE